MRFASSAFTNLLFDVSDSTAIYESINIEGSDNIVLDCTYQVIVFLTVKLSIVESVLAVVSGFVFYQDLLSILLQSEIVSSLIF